MLNARRVEFIVIGGVAYNFHASPRATKDIDLWVRHDRENVSRLVAAIHDFGFPTEGLDVEDLASSRRVLMLGRAPQRIDVLTRPDGLEWHGAWSRRIEDHYGDVPLSFLSLDDLIAAKRAAGRPRDLADVEALEAIRKLRDEKG